MPRPKTGAYGYAPMPSFSNPEDRHKQLCEKCSHLAFALGIAYCRKEQGLEPKGCAFYHDASKLHVKGLAGNPERDKGY